MDAAITLLMTIYDVYIGNMYYNKLEGESIYSVYAGNMYYYKLEG